ncbi:MAG: bacteriohemerythrin [Pseudomonadota bacterium]
MSSIDIFPWNENFNTGIPKIDEQHERLVGLLNQLASHVAFQSDIPTLEQIFDELADYAVYHFQTEESIWCESLSGDTLEVEHKRTHESFVSMIQEKRSQIAATDGEAIIEELLAYLTRWLATHILESDRYMAAVSLCRETGLSLDEAKRCAAERLGGNTKTLINLILSIYDSLSTNALSLMRELNMRKEREEKIRKYAQQLEEVFMKVVGLATTMSEMRDPYTVGHERRVAEIAVAIGREMGLDESQLEGIRIGASLHDLGKISIPAEILGKPGRLSDIEYSMIKSHPVSGYNILKDVGFPWPVDKIALQHHERMDGSGYPSGLKGDEILLEARIVAVADVVEAMHSHRPYRPGLGIAAALEEIRRGRGVAFDPAVVDSCLSIFNEKGFNLKE